VRIIQLIRARRNLGLQFAQANQTVQFNCRLYKSRPGESTGAALLPPENHVLNVLSEAFSPSARAK